MRIAVLCILACFSTLLLQSQQNKFRIEWLNTDNGLLSNSIRGLQLESENGILWIATEAGLARYNGYELETFQDSIYPSEFRKRIIAFDKVSNDKFFGLTNDYNLFSINKNRINAVQTKQPINSVEALFYINRGFKHPPLRKPPINVEDVSCFSVYGNSYLYGLGTLYNMDDGKEHVLHNLSEKYFGFILNNRLFFLDLLLKTKEWKKDNKFVTLGKLSLSNSGNYSLKETKLFQDANSRKVFLITGKRMYEIVLVNNHLHAELIFTGLPEHENIQHFQYDPLTNSYYFGTENNGIFIARPNYFDIIQNKVITNSNGRSLYAQLELKNGNIQMNTGDIFGINQQTLQLFTPVKELNFPTLFVNSDSVIFYANANYIHLVDLKKDSELLKRRNVSTYNYGFLEKDKVTYLINPTSISHFDSKFQLTTDYTFPFIGQVYDVKLIEGNKMMIAAEQGLFTYNIKTFSFLKIYQPPNSIHIRSIVQYKNFFFLGTYGAGILVYSQGAIKQISGDRMKYLNFAHCFVPMNDGTIWISTNKGLFRARANDLIRSFNEPLYEPQYQYFGKNEGLIVTEFNGGCTPCAIQLMNGKLSFPTINGLVQFDPNKIPSMKRNVNIGIDRIIINNTTQFGHTLPVNELPVSTKNISFKLFVGGVLSESVVPINYSIDDGANWDILNLQNPVITIPTPVSGNYNLLLKFPDKSTNQYSQISWKFSVAIPWNHSIYFYVTVTILLIALIWGIIKLRSRQLENSRIKLETEVEKKTRQLNQLNETLISQNQVKSRTIAILNHDLLTPLRYMHIAAKRTELKIEDLSAKRSIHQIASTSKSLEMLASNMLNWVKFSEATNLPSLEFVQLKKIVQNELLLLSPMFPNNVNVAIINLVAEEEYVTTRPEMLRVVLFNILLNAFRATQSGSITVSSIISKTDDLINSWSIHIIDTGKGMSKVQADNLIKGFTEISNTMQEDNIAPIGNGVGYRIINDILKLMKGKLLIESELGKGTKVSVYFQ